MLMETQVFEYYDGYEHLWEDEQEEQRQRVQYIVLGTIDHDLVGICYLGTLNFTACIGKKTHSRAWLLPSISLNEAREAVAKAKKRERKTLDEYKEKYKDLIETKTHTKCSSHHSISDGIWDVSFSWDNTRSYESQFAKEIQKKILLFEIRDAFLSEEEY